MENNNTENTQRKFPWKGVIAIVASVALVTCGFVYLMITTAEDTAKRDEALRKESVENATCTFKRDSLQREVNALSIYRSLTKAMVHRDEATSLLKYKVGDFVYMKRDSAKVVISDIVIGGSKYEYYVRYRVLHKDKTEEDVIPELIY